MTTRTHPRPLRPTVLAFARFVVCGGGVGLASSGVLLLLHERMPLAVATALVTVVSTLVATELHGRVSFRSERSGWAVHLRSGLTVLVGYAFTTGALLGLYALRPDPSVLTEQAVYLGASALAGVGRFAVLRLVVFAERPAPAAGSPAPAAGPALSRAAVVIAA
ncbi:GtrA family protein [Streptomyces chryseus]